MKCRNCGKIFFCTPSSAKQCVSSKMGLTECVSGGSCDKSWRTQTGYHGEMLNDINIKEKVEFT